MQSNGMLIDDSNVRVESCSQQVFRHVCDEAYLFIALIEGYAGTLNDTAVSQFEFILFLETNKIYSLSENKLNLFSLSE